MALPQLTGTARLTVVPELRYSPSGVAVCAMHLAFNSRKQDPSGAWVDGDALFIKATAFRELAEHCAETLVKGTEVVITGRVKTEQWQTTDGEKHSAPALLLDSLGPSLRTTTATINKPTRPNGTSTPGTEPPF